MGGHLPDGEDRDAQDEHPHVGGGGEAQEAHSPDDDARHHGGQGPDVLHQAAHQHLQQDDGPAVDHRHVLGVELEGDADARKEAVHGGGVHEVPEVPEHRSEVLEVEDPETGVHHDHEHEAGVPQHHGRAVGHFPEALGVRRLGWILEEKQGRQQHGRTVERGGDEDVAPGKALEDAHRQRGQEGADVDHPVVDAEPEAGVLLGGGAGQGATDDGLEETRTGSHEQEGCEDRAVGRDVAGDEVAGGQDAEGEDEHAPVAVAIRQGATGDGDDIGEGVDEALQEAHGLLREAQTPGGHLVREVDSEHRVEAVVGGPLEELHDIGHPEHPGESTEEAGGLRIGHPQSIAAPCPPRRHRCQQEAPAVFLGALVPWWQSCIPLFHFEKAREAPL